MELEQTDLIALIMFLVFEKKVLTLDDEAKELDLYFLPKHKERMNHELAAYKEKLSMKYPKALYVVDTYQGERFVRAVNETDAIVRGKGTKARLITDEYLYINDEKYKTKNILEEQK